MLSPMTHTIRAAELRAGDRYLSPAHTDARALTVTNVEASKILGAWITVTVTDETGATYRSVYSAERELEAAEVITAPPVIHFSLDANAWVSTDGREVCQDHASLAPCAFC